jgi:hypothetical protein
VQTVKAALNAAGLRRLDERKRLTAELTSPSADATLAEQTVTFVLPKKHKRH